MSAPGVLVAGVGNVLRGDDGFGPAVVRRLLEGGVPPGVHVVELGIGGMHLVQHLLDGYDGLVVVDVAERDQAPGTVSVLEPEVPAPEELSATERHRAVADPHQATPGPAFLLARAAGVLPPFVRLVTCQPADVEECVPRLTPRVAAAVPGAATAVRRLLAELGAGAVSPARERESLREVAG